MRYQNIILALILMATITGGYGNQIDKRSSINQGKVVEKTTTKAKINQPEIKPKQGKVQKLKSGNQASFSSSAFSFTKLASVDARTGILNFSLPFLSAAANQFNAQEVFLKLVYSQQGGMQVFGLGNDGHWGFNLSHYNSKTQQLSLSSGQSFTLYPNDIRGGTFTIKYHRLKDVIIKASPNGFTPYQIIFKDGHTEYLSNQGYEIKSCSEEGYCVNFDYNNVQPYPEITSITSDSGSVLYKFIWSSSHYLQRLDVLPQSSSSSSYYFDYDGQTDELNQITMPDDGKINITFCTSGYCEGHTGLIGELSFPTGLTIKYNYLLDGLIYPPLANAPIRSVAAISSQTLLPDGTHNESQAYTTTYSYGGNQANNYLGYGVSGSFNLSEDALYLANNDYKYQTIVTEPEGTETIQDYNKFHLLTSQARQDDKGNPLSKIYYCYGGNIGYCKGSQHIIDPPDKPESASCDAYPEYFISLKVLLRTGQF